MAAESMVVDMNALSERDRVRMLAVVEAAVARATKFMQSDSGMEACSGAFYDYAREAKKARGALTEASIAEAAAITAASVALEAVRLCAQHLLDLSVAVSRVEFGGVEA